VTQVIGPLVTSRESQGPFCSVGEVCEITRFAGTRAAGRDCRLSGHDRAVDAAGIARGVRHGDRVSTWGERPTIRVGEGCWGG
jgi:flagellum-specific ATP synthase